MGSETCHDAFSWGMAYKDLYIRDSHDQESKKHSQPHVNSKPFVKQGGHVMVSNGSKSSSSNSLQDNKKPYSKYEPSSEAQGSSDTFCYICGFKKHLANVCQKKDMTDNIYLNFDKIPYRKSSAWQRLLADYPHLLSSKILDYPRYISGESVNKLSGSSATTSHKRKHTGESVPSSLLRIINNCEDCDSPCDQILFNLSSDTHSHQY